MMETGSHTRLTSVSYLEVVFSAAEYCTVDTTRMWANALRDGRPAKYRWCPLLTPQSLADAHY